MEFGRPTYINADYKDRKIPLSWEMRLFVHTAFLDKTPPTVPPLVYQLQDHHVGHFSKDSLILLGEVVEIDKKKKQIVLSNKNVVAYDHLIIATGAKQDASSVEEEFAAGFKALTDALKMQETIPSSFCAISREPVQPSSYHCEVGCDERVDPICRIIQPIDISKKSSEIVDLHSSHKRLYEVQL